MSEQSANKVQLGCGTLIIIALIVMLFSGRNELQNAAGELEDISRKLDRIEKKVDELSQKVGRPPGSEPLERK